MKVNLENIRKYFPMLKRFIARLTEKEVDLLSEKNKTDVDTDKVLECLSKCWTVVAFGESFKTFDIDIPIESLEATVEWLAVQNKADTDILLNKLNMIDNLDFMDYALYQLYEVLADALREV